MDAIGKFFDDVYIDYVEMNNPNNSPDLRSARSTAFFYSVIGVGAAVGAGVITVIGALTASSLALQSLAGFVAAVALTVLFGAPIAFCAVVAHDFIQAARFIHNLFFNERPIQANGFIEHVRELGHRVVEGAGVIRNRVNYNRGDEFQRTILLKYILA